MAEVVAVLGRGVVDPDAALLRADDLGALRGDGIFETLNVRDGVPRKLELHLDRMVRSAAKMELSLPPVQQLRELAAQACKEFGDRAEGALRLVVTRGPESGGEPFVYATVNPVPAAQAAARRDGLRLVSLSLGYPVDARASAPWLLGGAKTLSYAVTMAAQRHARASGYDDALWVSSDGFALEAPTATLVWLSGRTLLTVAEDTGILFGTTAALLFAHAGELGLDTATARIRPAELAAADGVWLTSSVRGVAQVNSLDGVEMNRSDVTARLQDLAGFVTPA
jgi:4-amino-4-deoxychorismate lyase